MGQHGDDPVHQIDAGPSLKRFPVQCGISLDIIGHVRNVHPEMIVFAFLCHMNRIIQILGVLPVNGDHPDPAKISSALHVRLRDIPVQALRLAKHLLRKFHGQIVASNH